MFKFTNNPIIRGIIGYEEEYFVKIKDIPVPIANKSLILKLPCTIYSLPTNDKQEVNSKHQLGKAIDLEKVSKYYGKYPIGATVEGRMIGGLFIVDRIIKYPKTIK